MNRRLKLLKQRADALEAAKVLNDDNCTDEQRTAAKAALESVAGIDAQLAELDALQAAEAALPATSSARVTENADNDPMRGFRSAGEFGRAVRAACQPGSTAQVDPRLARIVAMERGAAPTNFHNEGHAEDGYMVPPQMREGIMQLVFEADDLLSLATLEPTNSNVVELRADESTPWGSTGIQSYWLSEGAQLTKSRLSTEPRQVRLHKLAALVLASDELLEDAPLLSSRLTAGAARAIGYKASNALMRGTGAGQPLGWLNAPCKIEVAKESGQAADTIVAKNILKMYSRRLVQPGGRWLWLANGDVVPQFVDLKIGNEPSWVGQSQGLQAAPSGMLLGVPVRFVEHCSTLGDAGDIQLVDMAGYLAIVKAGGGIKFDASIHLYFDYAVSAFRWIFRIGGMPFLSAAVSPDNGSTTKSHFITLAERA